MPEIIRVVGAVIFDPKSDRYYVGQRAKNKKHPLKWEFIGGKVMDGEDILKATEREFKEEVNQDIVAEELLKSWEYDYGGEIGKIEINFVKCKCFTGEPKFNVEVYKVCKWIPKNELSNLDWIEADKEFGLSLI